MKNIITLFLTLFISISAFAAAGDDCSTAISVSSNGCSTVGAYNNTGVTGTLMPPACFGAGNNNGMWFKFIATMPVVNITVNGGTLVTPMVGLFSSTVACGSPFLELGCSNPGTIAVSLPYSALTVGNTYYIYVDGANNTTGTFQLCLTSPSQPSNDLMCNAISLPVSNFCSATNAYTNVGATADMTSGSTVYPASCWTDGLGSNNGVWFKFVPTGNAVDISINGLSSAILSVVQPPAGDCNSTDYANFLQRTCGQSTSGSTTTATSTFFAAGQTYYILVDGYNNSTGSFQICINSYIPTSSLVNDACSGSIPLCPGNVYNGTTEGGNYVSATDPPAPWGSGSISPAVSNACNGDDNYTVYYDFWTTAANSPVSVQITPNCVTPNANLLQVGIFAVRNNNPCTSANWTKLVCDASSQSFTSPFTLSTTSAMTAASTHYYIVFDSFPDTPCGFSFSIAGNQGAAAGTDQTVCLNAAAFNLPGFSPTTGGTWSGPGITNSVTGTFNPASAGIGSHTLYYSYGPCVDSKIVNVTGPTVVLSNSVSICPLTCTTLLGVATQPTVIVTNPSFSIAPNTTIPTNSTFTTTSAINVSGLSNASLSSICLNINHTKDRDLSIYLICPSGTTLELSDGNGGNNDNYTGTCFSSIASIPITGGAAPFSGSYIPGGGALTTLNGCTMNGNWTLLVIDDGGGSDGGTFLNWTLTFQNNVTNTIPVASFTWSPTTAMTGGSTLSPTVCPVSTTVYSLTGTDSNGCTATDATTVMVTPVTITVTPSSTLCAGGSKTLTASGATTYSWSPATGLSSTSGSSVVASPTITTTYTVTGTLGVCSNTNIVTITVTNLTLSVVSPSVCVGLSGSLSAGGASTYTWSPVTGLSPTTGATVTASPTITTTYSVIGTTTAGCIGTQTAIVTVNPKPLATLNFTNPTCGLSNGVVFINNTSPASPPQTISTYTSNLGSVSGQTVTGLAASSPIITLTNNFGCTFTISTTLTNTPGPSAFSLTPTNTTCGNINGALSFGAPVTGGTSPYTYSVNNAAASSPTTGLAIGTYSVTIKDLNNCILTQTTSIINVPGPTAITGTTTPAGCSLSNGTYNVTGVTGGTPSYSFAVDAAALSTTSLTGSLASGTHSITVKDLNSCIFTTTFTIIQTTGPTSATVSAGIATCGSANGTATVTGVTGGTPTYSYSYDGGGYTLATNTASLLAGNHTVTIKDVNTCTLSVPYTVLNNSSPTATVTGFTDPLCTGESTGSFSLSASGGSGAPFTYTVTSPFQSNGTGIFSGLPAGTYNISIKDMAGCATTASVVLTDPSPVIITATASPAKCFNAATGSISVTGSGGTPTYSYNLNGGTYQTSSDFTSQIASIYSMGIKDVNGCLSTQTVQVTQPTALAIQVASQNANCTAANGIGTATVTGGTPIYTYSWTGGGGTAATSNGVVTGNYTVMATDANSCVISSPVAIGLTTGGTASITAQTNITCVNANNGSLTAGMIGGTSPFTYSWSPGTQTVATAVNLGPATYTCVITDFYGCEANTSGTIIEPSELTAIMNSNNVKCFGTSTGTVSAAGSGGIGPYTYLWPTIPSTLSTVGDVAVGDYSCSITDFNGCSITRTIAVTQPTTITLTPTVTSANCNQANGSATITASGGAPGAYTYTWSSGSNTTIQNSVAAGTYTIIVQDANNCMQTLAVTIPNTSGPVISIASQTNVSCFGGSNGAAITSVSGGVGTYTYSWSNGNVSSIATNLANNIYTVSATDGAGCVASTSVNITQPTQLTVSILITNPKCSGAIDGFGIAAALGGTPSYTYAWTSTGGGLPTSDLLGAGNYGLSVTDGNGCIVTSSMALVNPPAMAAGITATNVSCNGTCNGTAIATSTNGIGAISYFWTGGPSSITGQTANGLCAGSYTVLATDQNSCTASAQIAITEPAALTATISLTGSVTCNGGNNGFATVTPAGGTGAYSYTWSPSGGNTETANTLIAGVYIATVQDANLCTATATATIIEPTPLTTTLTTNNVKCSGACDGEGNITFAGGAGTTSFFWLPGLQSGNLVSNLCVGSQTVIITSNGTCTTALTFTLESPALLTAVASATNSNCEQNNGKTCVLVGGGTVPYSNLWSNGVSTLCNNNILAGAYSFTVTDFNGCKAFASGLVNDIAGPVVSIISQTNISCFNGNNGAATTTITGGVPSYSISWTNGQTTQNVADFNVGIKNITVIDAAGCIGTASVDITQPEQLFSAITNVTDVTCNGLSNGEATMLVSGGQTPYTYTWSPSAQTTSVMVGVPANTYTVGVTDANGCLTSKQVSISEPALLVMTTSSVIDVSCSGGNNGQISTSFAGGTLPYTYSWTPSGSGPILNGLTAGGYSLSLVDFNNCPESANFMVSQPPPLSSSYTSLPATCNLSNGSATVTIFGGSPIYSVVWNLPGTPTGTTAINMPPGNNWTANITDSKGCSITQTVSVANPPVPIITGFTIIQPTCFGLIDGNITINYTSGTAPYTVAWSNPISQTTTATAALTQSVASIAAGSYSATLIDNYGCSSTMPVNVGTPTPLTIIPTRDTTICYGASTQISASGQGGNWTLGAYTYSWTPNTFEGAGPHTVNPITTTTYIVSVKDIKGCSASPKVITVNVTPPLTIISTSITLCHGTNGILTPTMTSVGKGGPYSYIWNPSAATTSVISVTGNAPSGPTVVTYSLTVEDRCSPNSTAVFTVNTNPLPAIDFAPIASGCSPLTTTLIGSPMGGSEIFTWSDNKGGSFGPGNNLPVTYVDSGKYTITLNAVNPVTTCSNTITKIDHFEVYPQPIASFYADPQSAGILDPNINFFNTTQGATGYFWNFGDPAAINGSNNSTEVNPSHEYTYIGLYSVNLVAASLKGCTDTARISVEIAPEFALYIPNTFTPDGNGLNDVFQPMGVGIDEENYRMDIFDRWGENIFSSNNFRKGWDGTVKGSSTIAEQGVYTYKVMVKDIMGNKHPMVGHVTILKQN